MKRIHKEIIEHWLLCVRSAIRERDLDAAYRFTVGFVRRLREIGLLADTPAQEQA